jgi:hypothetical protein
MPFTLPQFNLLADVWYCGRVPDDGDPDAENITVQLYLNPRGPFGMNDQFTEFTTLFPPMFVRMPLSAVSEWEQSNIWEIPAESGRYYLVVFKERMHQGFPNEYLLAQCVQCDAEGQAARRNVCAPVNPNQNDGGGTGNLQWQLIGDGTNVDPQEGSGAGVFGWYNLGDGDGSS